MARPIAISRHEILDAATAEFAERGYANTSLRQLMSAAGVSTTAFYSRYPSKEAVLIALVSNLMAELFARGSATLTEVADVDEGIAAGIELLAAAMRAHRPVVALALTEGAAIPEVRDVIGDALTALAGLLARQIAASRGSRRRSRGDRARAWSLVGALHLQILRWAVYGQVADGELERELTAVARAALEDR